MTCPSNIIYSTRSMVTIYSYTIILHYSTDFFMCNYLNYHVKRTNYRILNTELVYWFVYSCVACLCLVVAGHLVA